MARTSTSKGSQRSERELRAVQLYQDHVNPSLAKVARFSACDRIEVRGTGALVYDSSGREYVDCVGGFGALSAGHAHPRIVQAMTEQLSRLGVSTKMLLNEPMIQLAAALAEITPGDLQYSFFVNSGTEAVEAALKVARLATGRPGVVFTSGGFHGKTLGALSACGRELYRKPFERLLPGFVQVPYGDADAVRAALAPEVGAVLVEPIQGEGGVIVPPSGYLSALRELATEAGVLLLVDEVQTGLGRTGHTFAVDAEGVVPDVLILAKALGGGVAAIGAIVGRPDAWKEMIRNPTLHSTTFGGNAPACAAALAFLDVLREEKLAENAARLGGKLKKGLENVASQWPEVISEVRGRGLLLGVELADVGLTAELCTDLVRRGVLAFYTVNNEQVVRVEPALVITDDQVDRVVEAFAAAVGKVAEIAAPKTVVAS